jgi:hypothetical protein
MLIIFKFSSLKKSFKRAGSLKNGICPVLRKALHPYGKIRNINKKPKLAAHGLNDKIKTMHEASLGYPEQPRRGRGGWGRTGWGRAGSRLGKRREEV